MSDRSVMLINLAARDARIVEWAKSGETRGVIADRLGLTGTRITQILQRDAPDVAKIFAQPRVPAAIVERARMLWHHGLSASDIAHHISRDGHRLTKDSVIGMAHRNGFPPRPSPIIRSAEAAE